MGSRKVVIAVLDDGFFYNHEDLAGNIWANPGESGPDASGHPKETNGKNDDVNGYIDDLMGWDFAFGDPDPNCYIFDGMRKDRIQTHWHSISALDIVGAKGNNGIGVAGINWNVSMMLLKIGAQGIGRDEKDTIRPGQQGHPLFGRQLRMECPDNFKRNGPTTSSGIRSDYRSEPEPSSMHNHTPFELHLWLEGSFSV